MKKYAIDNSDEEGERLELASIKNIRVPGTDEFLMRLPPKPQYQESQKRNATPPAVIPQPQEPSLIDRY